MCRSLDQRYNKTPMQLFVVQFGSYTLRWNKMQLIPGIVFPETRQMSRQYWKTLRLKPLTLKM